jgi:hypothetical protein
VRGIAKGGGDDSVRVHDGEVSEQGAGCPATRAWSWRGSEGTCQGARF